MWVGSHPAVALRRQLGQFCDQSAIFIEEFLCLVALHPFFQELYMIGMCGIDEQRDLMRSKCSLDLQTVDDLRACPALGRLEDDHWPAWPSSIVVVARVVLELVDILDGLIDGGGHQFVHLLRLIPSTKYGVQPQPLQELVQFLMLDASQHGRIADLVAVEVQDRQHGPVGLRIEKLVGLP